MAQGLVGLTLQNINFINGLARPQGLDDGIASLDDAIGLSSECVLLLFVHGFSLAVENFVVFCVSISQEPGTIKLNLQKLHEKSPPRPCGPDSFVIYCPMINL